MRVPARGEVVLRAARHDVLAVFNELLKYHLEIEDARLNAVHQRQHIKVERVLQLSEFEKLVKNLLGYASFLSSMTMRTPSLFDSSRKSLMPSTRFSRTRSAIFLQDRGLVHLIWHLGHDNRKCAILLFDNVGLCTHYDSAAAGLVRLLHRLCVIDNAAGRKIGALHEFEKVVDGAP